MTMPLSLDRLWCISEEVLPDMFCLAARRELTAQIDRQPLKRDKPDRVSIIDLVGPLTKYRNLFSMLFGGTAMTQAAAEVRAAAQDDRVGNIVLYVDSPGGTVAGVDELAQAIYDARQIKPVIGYISDLGASGAYYAVSQATKVYANRGAFVGSIGVYSVVTDFSKAFAAEGVRVDVIRAGALKGSGVPGTEVTDAQRAQVQRIVDASYELFVGAWRVAAA
jgi:signal peptide peptidase SppA